MAAVSLPKPMRSIGRAASPRAGNSRIQLNVMAGLASMVCT